MKFRNLIFVLAIAFSAIFVGMLGTSYAYYVVSNGAKIEVTTGDVDTGAAVVFEQSQYININTGVPIASSMVDTLASASVFKITPNKDVLTGYDAVINIGITDLYIDDALRVEDFKYRLSCDDGTTFNGVGTSFTENILSSGYLPLATLSTSDATNPLVIGQTYTCTFRVWLEENCDDIDNCETNQNHLMNKKFRGLVKVNTLFKKSDVVENG